ncbi:LADA_0G10440g1_1 [Lachancea dasiensis]|uniref:DNA replication regulator SLD2 n=1 Tax=Lachancea dasiensis TaxID=1072105 RepID=A0A1G4JUP2_9SACH|nr:LADA_0G10440g1_1 [Lachancea dasiensis]
MDQLKLELKRFERKFESKYGRTPTREDIRSLPDIKNKYKQYAVLQVDRDRKRAVENSVTEHTPQKEQSVEFGPTPQIYGKVMGLFDLRMSPIKNATVRSPGLLSGQGNKTLEPPKPTGSAIYARYTLTPRKSPKSTSKYGPNSPLKFDDVHLSVRTPKRNLQSLLAANGDSSVGSPSPIIKRPLGKPLLQIARETEKILEEMEEFSDEDVVSRNVRDVFRNEDGSEDDLDTEDEVQEQEKIVPKRSKRKHILRPAKNALALTSEPPQVNIKEEMARLKQEALDELRGIQPSGAAVSQATTAKTATTNANPKRSRNRKYNLVSSNFRRLKLPTSKGRGNKRWGRR